MSDTIENNTQHQAIQPQDRSRRVPLMGFGTFNEFRDAERVAKAVEHAVKVGYRHFDLAALYANEREVGEALRNSMDRGDAKREDLCIASKLWNTHHRPALVPQACDKSLEDIGVDYLDVYMLHWPTPWKPTSNLRDSSFGGSFHFENDEEAKLKDTWRAMERLVEEGKVKHIGVSNFSSRLLDELLDFADIPPVANEVEMHPYLSQQRLVDFCDKNNIHVTAYSPLGKIGYRNEGDPSLIEDPVLVKIAQELDRTPAQVALRWNIQRGVGVIPKSLTPHRIEQNYKALEFELSPEHMDEINALNRNFRFVRPPWYDFPDDEHEFQ